VECSFIGRDLVRALRDAAAVSKEINQVYQSVAAGKLPKLPSIEKLLAIPTPRYFLQSRLSHELEANLLFIVENVIFYDLS
jgi:hypothetical protein